MLCYIGGRQNAFRDDSPARIRTEPRSRMDERAATGVNQGVLNYSQRTAFLRGRVLPNHLLREVFDPLVQRFRPRQLGPCGFLLASPTFIRSVRPAPPSDLVSLAPLVNSDHKVVLRERAGSWFFHGPLLHISPDLWSPGDFRLHPRCQSSRQMPR
jgi:hypothetical protein